MNRALTKHYFAYFSDQSIFTFPLWGNLNTELSGVGERSKSLRIFSLNCMYRGKGWKRSSDLRSSSNRTLDIVWLKQPFKSFIRVVAAFYILSTDCFSSDDDHRFWFRREKSLHYVKTSPLAIWRGMNLLHLPPDLLWRQPSLLLFGSCWFRLRRVSHSEIKDVSYSLKHTPYHAALGGVRGTPTAPHTSTASQHRGSVRLTA